MTELQLSIRSTRAHKIAKQLARKERRTVRQVVERALETYAKTQNADAAVPPQESDADFWLRIRRENRLDEGADIDLEAVIREHRKPHLGIDL